MLDRDYGVLLNLTALIRLGLFIDVLYASIHQIRIPPYSYNRIGLVSKKINANYTLYRTINTDSPGW